MLEKIKLKHNTPEWLQFRKTGIGGSDAAAILGISPFKTNIEVWEEKVGIKEPEDISDKPQVEYGKKSEELLLELFALDFPQFEVKANKNVVYKRGFMFASLDGELTDKTTGEEGIYEGKTTEIHNHNLLSKWTKQIPDYYYTQILHYLLVTDRKFACLKAQIKLMGQDDNVEIITRHYMFYRKDLIEDLKYLYLKEKEFWEFVEKKQRPPLILPRLD